MLMNTGSKSLQTTLDVIRSSLGVYVILPASLYFGSVSLVYGQEESGVNTVGNSNIVSRTTATNVLQTFVDDGVQGSGRRAPPIPQVVLPLDPVPKEQNSSSNQHVCCCDVWLGPIFVVLCFLLGDRIMYRK